MAKDKVDHGKNAEDFIEKICLSSYLADFIIRDTLFTTPGGKQREFADLLIPFKETLFTFQVRSKLVKFKATKAKESDLQRVVRKVEDAVNQIKTLKRAIDTGAIKHVKNLSGISIPFNSERIKNILGIVVVDLINPQNLPEKEKLQLYNTLKYLKGTAVHIFLRNDFELIVKELDTIPDLTRYLKVREALMNKKILFPLTNESDFLAIYQTQYEVIEQCLTGKIDRLYIDDGIWKSFAKPNKEALARRAKRHKKSLIVDYTISTVNQCIGYAIKDSNSKIKPFVPSTPGTVQQYITIAEELAGLNRIHRMEFGQKMLEKARRADNDKKGFSYCAYCPDQSGTSFVYLSFKGDRVKRRDLLYSIASATYVHFGITRLVGIATENFSFKKRSHDFILLDSVSFKNEEELRAFGSKIFQPAKKSSTDQWGNNLTKE